MTSLAILFSHQCCGGPVTVLSLGLAAIGATFALLSATNLGLVFASIGIATLALCCALCWGFRKPR